MFFDDAFDPFSPFSINENREDSQLVFFPSENFSKSIISSLQAMHHVAQKNRRTCFLHEEWR